MTLARHKLVFVKHVRNRVGMLIYSYWKITSIGENEIILRCEVSFKSAAFLQMVVLTRS